MNISSINSTHEGIFTSPFYNQGHFCDNNRAGCPTKRDPIERGKGKGDEGKL